MKSPAALRGGKTLTSSLVIALTLTVISTAVQCTSIAAGDSGAPAPAAAPAAPAAPIAAPVAQQPEGKPKVEAAAPLIESAKAATAAAATSGEQLEAANGARRGRSEAPQAGTEKPELAAESKDKPAGEEKKTTAAKAAEPKDKQASGASVKQASAAGSKQQLGGKSGAPSGNKKLPANLGTVTSTGSGGPAHYMSKHDAYSAIAEKHGALAQDAMRKADKRQHHHSSLHQRFGGIQKASGLGDMMSPFKGVTDSGLARTLGASVRSIMKGKYSVPAYVASAVLGAVALMAFYESPISPLPVPALPEPPVGRFPPEMPNISPNLQVPFRMNQGQQNQGQYGQQGYQRSFQAGQQQPGQPGQVLFPSAAVAQQRSGQVAPPAGGAAAAPAGPVQQLAANLISSVAPGRQTAQRKSGPDYEAASSRSFFGSSSGQPAGVKLAAPANGQQQHQQHHGHHNKASSILNFLGLGGGGGASDAGASSSAGANALGHADIQRASALSGHHQIAAGGGPVSSASGSEQKGQAALSNSHLVNKMKSYFDRPLGHAIWPVEQYAPNQYDQYRRMSIVQALAKDTAFLSTFFSPARRSSNATSVSASQLQQSISNVLAAAAGGAPAPASAAQAAANNVAAARMQVDSPVAFAYGLNQQPQQQPQQPIVNTKRASSGYGLMRAADRIGHALLDTFTSGLLHRSSQAQADSVAARKSEEQQQQQQNALASATSILSDIMSSYNAAQQQQQQQAAAAAPEQQGKQQSTEVAGKAAAQQQAGELAQGRSADQAAPGVSGQKAEQQQVASLQSKSHSQQHSVAAAAESGAASSSGASGSSSPSAAAAAAPQAALVRKTRSIGLDYPMEPMQPSRASQINNLVDLVSDSYKQNRLLFSFVMNQVGLSHALPYVDQFLGTPNEPKDQHV